jgi:hypothetical protein
VSNLVRLVDHDELEAARAARDLEERCAAELAMMDALNVSAPGAGCMFDDEGSENGADLLPI